MKNFIKDYLKEIENILDLAEEGLIEKMLQRIFDRGDKNECYGYRQ